MVSEYDSEMESPRMEKGPEQFITRLKHYLTRWVELSETDKKRFDGICELIVKEQFIHSWPEDLSIYLRERIGVPELWRKWLIRSPSNFSLHTRENCLRLWEEKQSPKEGNGVAGNEGNKDEKRIQCFHCKGYGHKAIDYRKTSKQDSRSEKRCLLCDRSGHLAKDCKIGNSKKNGPFKAGAAQKTGIENLIE